MNDAGKPSLVRGRRVIIIAGINGWAPAEQSVGKGRPAVILQWADSESCRRQIELVVGAAHNRRVERAEKVEAARNDLAPRYAVDIRAIVEQVRGAGVCREDGVLNRNHAGTIEQ